MKAGPPGWEPHKIVSRIDGWVIDPDDEDRIPTVVAEMIARAMPQLDDSVADVRARMCARHRKVLGHDEEIPANDGNAQPAASLAGTATAACVADNGGGPEEVDEYDALLAALVSTEEQDQRVALHELGHYLTNLLLGKSSISAVSITPGDGFEGICWGSQHAEAFVSPRRLDAASIREFLQPVMPTAGEDRGGAADIFQSVADACTELMAGIVAEKMLLEGKPSSGFDDLCQATELASSLFCKSESAVAAFLALCERQAFDLRAEHVTVLMSMQIVLRIRRTMTGEEIDRAIATVVAGQALALERMRRAAWRHTVENAVSFATSLTT